MNKFASGPFHVASSFASMSAAAVVARLEASVCSWVICGRRDLVGGAGSARRRRPPSSCLLSSGSASVSAVFPPALLGDPGGLYRSDSSGGGRLLVWWWRRQPSVASVQDLWKMESRSDSLLRRRRAETSNLQSGEHGDAPRPTSHKVSAMSICDGPLNRLTTLFQLWCFDGSGVWGCSSFLSPAWFRQRRWSATSVKDDVCKGLQGLYCYFVFSKNFYAKFWGHLCFWVLPSSAACMCYVCSMQ